MLKKLLMGGGIAGVLTLGAIIGSITLAPVFAHSTDANPPAQVAVQSVEDDGATEAAVAGPDLDDVEEQVGEQNEVDADAVDEQQPQYAGSIQIDENQNQGMSEADEASALQANATITAVEAEAAALAANPGATVIKTELDNENGALVYSVELSNGSEVKVDAGTAKILHTETAED